MTYTVSSGTLNSTIPYHITDLDDLERWDTGVKFIFWRVAIN